MNQATNNRWVVKFEVDLTRELEKVDGRTGLARDTQTHTIITNHVSPRGGNCALLFNLLNLDTKLSYFREMMDDTY